jgi:lipopolysaccharide transport system permease protein
MNRPATSTTRRLTQLRDLLRELVSRDLKVRYKRSVLGIAWSLLVPLAQLLVLYFVFNHVLPLGVPRFASFLITGLLPWSWFSASLSAATVSVVDNRQLVAQPGFPSTLLPVASVSSQGIHFLLGLPILFGLLLFDGGELTPTLLLLPLVIALQFVFTVGLAFFAASLQVIFEDTQHLLGILLMLLFYLTPVFYDPALVPDPYHELLLLNPMTVLLGLYRSLLLDGARPAASAWLSLTAGAVALCGAGAVLFWRARYRFVEDL